MEPLAEDLHTQSRQFLQFTLWFRQAAVLFGVAALAAAINWSDVWMGVTGGAVLLFAGFVTVGRRWMSRHRRTRAVMAVCAGVVLNSLFILGAQPVLFPTLLLAAILPVTLSLQYARPSAKRLCIGVAICLVATVAAVGRFHVMPMRVPGWFIATYLLTSVTVIGALFLVLVTQWSSRLADRLEEVKLVAREAASARQELALEHARLQAMVASQQDCVIAADQLGHVTLMNPAAEALTGWSFAEARLRHITEVVMLETDKETTEDIWTRVLRGGKPFDETRDVFLISRFGPRRPVAATAAAVHGPEGSDAAASAAAAASGAVDDEERDKDADLLVHEADDAQAQPQAESPQVLAQDQAEAPAVGAGKPAAIYGGIITLRDMSAHVEMLARLRQTERFDLIQRMAGIVGRDVRSAAQSIRGASETPAASGPRRANQERRRVPPPQPPEETVDDEGPYRISESFLALGRQARVSPQPFSPAQLIFDVAQSLPRMLGRHVMIVVQPGKEVGKAYADFDRMRDVLLQLSLAARQRMATGGTVTLAAHRMQIGDTVPGFVLGKIAAGTYIRLDVRDSGCGYSREQLLRLFEPFQFTTHKDVDHSLRLAATYGAIRQNAGALLVESRPRIGSTFSIYLPAADAGGPPKGDRTMGPI